MADFKPQTTMERTSSIGQSQADIDAGLRAYMLRVYNYMAVGLGITGFAAYFMAQLSFVTSESGEFIGFTSLGSTVFGSPLAYVIMLAPLGMVLLLSFRVHKMSASAAQITFYVFAAMMGISLATIFLQYSGTSITRVFFITTAAFAGLSFYGYTTQKDLTGWGSFLIMGLIGIIIASVVNIFMASSALQFAISVIGVLVFAGLTAYDTQKIKAMYNVNDDGTVAGRKAIMGALSLYLDFVNLFLMLLRLFGSRD